MNLIDKKEILGINFNIYGNIQDPIFNANDIAKIIENSNVSQMLKDIDDDEKQLVEIIRENGSSHRQWFLKEYGVYEVLLKSRNPKAKIFRKEVKEILKSIRLKGGYITIKATDNEKIIEERLNILVNDAKEKLKREIENYEKFFENSKELVSIEFLSNKYGMNRNQFINLMHKRGLLYEKGKNIYLYRKYKYKGLVKYYKSGDKNIIKFTLKGEKEINDLIENEV